MNSDSLLSILQLVSGWVWQTSLAATVLIAVVWTLQFLCQKVLSPRWQYALWMLVLVRLVMPVAPSTSYSLLNLFRPLQNQSVAPASAVTTPPLPIPSAQLVAPIEGQQKNLLPAPVATATAVTAQSAHSHWNILAAAPYVWLLGALSYLLVVLWQHRRLACWVKRQTPLQEPRLLTLMQECKRMLGLKRDFAVIISTSLGTPTLFGAFKPRLLLPKTMLDNFPELRLVLLHELVHLRRRDVLQNWLLICLQALHWFNPAVWLAFKRLRADRELLCDAKVLACLSADEQHAYGTALINLFERLSQPLLGPTLVPIINHKHQIHRRIAMIAQFKRTPRLLTLASALLLVAVGSLTLTGAAERPASKPANKPPSTESGLNNAEEVPPGLKVLQQEYERQADLVRKTQEKVDRLKEEFGAATIVESGISAGNALEPNVFQRIEALRIEAQSQYLEIQTLYSHLTNLNHLSRADLKKAIPTAAPDPVLNSLLEQQNLAEQKLAETSMTYGNEHEQVKRAKRVLVEIVKQVDDRIDGILEGLKTKTAAYKARVDSLRQEADQVKKTDIERAIKLRPYFEAKRELENYQAIRDRLQMRIIQERVDAAIPHSR